MKVFKIRANISSYSRCVYCELLLRVQAHCFTNFVLTPCVSLLPSPEYKNHVRKIMWETWAYVHIWRLGKAIKSLVQKQVSAQMFCHYNTLRGYSKMTSLGNDGRRVPKISDKKWQAIGVYMQIVTSTPKKICISFFARFWSPLQQLYFG